MDEQKGDDGDKQRHEQGSSREQDGKQSENRAETINDDDRLPVAESGTNELIMDMFVVRPHDAMVVLARRMIANNVSKIGTAKMRNRDEKLKSATFLNKPSIEMTAIM